MKLLVADTISKKGIAVLESYPDITYDLHTNLSHQALVECIALYDAIIIRSSTQVTAEILRHATRLKIIGRAGVGVDNVDVAEASRRGILVLNTPDVNTISTCEHTIALLLSLSRYIPQADRSLKNGEWNRAAFTGSELYGKTLGIVGYGRIGKAVAARMHAFGMRILVYDPACSTGVHVEDTHCVTAVSLDELCAQSDFLSIHVPHTDDTRYLFDRARIARLKDGVRLINCARGGIIDEEGLYDALIRGKVRAAALDVFESEPPINRALVELDNVIAVPHLGAATEEARENVGSVIAQQVVDALVHGTIRNAVNGDMCNEHVSQLVNT